MGWFTSRNDAEHEGALHDLSKLLIDFRYRHYEIIPELIGNNLDAYNNGEIGAYIYALLVVINSLESRIVTLEETVKELNGDYISAYIVDDGQPVRVEKSKARYVNGRWLVTKSEAS